ncbi:MAG: hypothetical protein ABI859_10160 [Pseudomonadota bacterium]
MKPTPHGRLTHCRRVNRLRAAALHFVLVAAFCFWQAPASAGVNLPQLDPVAVDTSYASTAGDTLAKIRFVNQLSVAVDVYWIDYAGARVFYNTLAAGASYDQSTWITHPWVIVVNGTGGTTTQGTGQLATAFLPQTAVGVESADFDTAVISASYPPDAQHISNEPIALSNDPVDVIQTNHFLMTASKVTTSGQINADFCIAPDPREVLQPNGSYKYGPRVLKLAELKNKGTCTGATGDLLVQSKLEISPWFRAFPGKGKAKAGAPVTGIFGYWIVVALIRSPPGQDVVYDGAVGVRPMPEDLIDYSGAAVGGSGFLDPYKGGLKCNAARDWRPLSLGASVQAFGEEPNIEGNRMIPETAQCDGYTGITKRTTHVYAMRLDFTQWDEAINVALQIDGLARTLDKAAGSTCISNPTVKTLRADLVAASLALLLRRFLDAQQRVEHFATTANGAIWSATTVCRTANYKGALVARSVTAAFTVFDRFRHPTVAGWEIYFPPEALELPLVFRECDLNEGGCSSD